MISSLPMPASNTALMPAKAAGNASGVRRPLRRRPMTSPRGMPRGPTAPAVPCRDGRVSRALGQDPPAVAREAAAGDIVPHRQGGHGLRRPQRCQPFRAGLQASSRDAARRRAEARTTFRCRTYVVADTASSGSYPRNSTILRKASASGRVSTCSHAPTVGFAASRPTSFCRSPRSRRRV